MPTILITGANRGLGLEFARQYASIGWYVIACCRTPDRAKELQILGEQYPDTLDIHSLNVCDHEAIGQLAKELENKAIDILLNNAGVIGSRNNQFNNVDYEDWLQTFRVNTLAPMKLSQAFFHHVKNSAMKKMVFMTSKMGSMADNESGGSYIYRSSKAGLNAVVKSITLDLHQHGICTLLLHPGWAMTDMGGSNALVSAEESVKGMIELINVINIKDTGAFKDYQGNNIPW